MAIDPSRAIVLTIAHPSTPELTALCRQSVKTLEPRVEHCIWPNWGTHWKGLHDAKAYPPIRRADIIILLDTDVVVLSPDWFDILTEGMDGDIVASGAIKHSGRIQDVLYGDRLLLHPSCVAMRRDVFMNTDFRPRGRWDTGAAVVFGQGPKAIRYFGFWPIGEDPIYGGLDVGVYTDGMGRVLWSHLMHGTGMQLKYPRWTYRLRAGFGSQTATTLLRRDDQKTQWMQRSWSYLLARSWLTSVFSRP